MADAWFGLFFGGMIMLVGIICVVGVLLTFLKLSQIRQWQTTPGIIVRSQIETDTGPGIDTAGYTYRNSVAYDYQVAGQRYTGKKVAPFFLNTDQPGRSARVAERYPLGRTVTVYYNPAKPQDSLLEPGGLRWVGLLVGVVMLGATIFGWMFVREALQVLMR